MRPALARHDAEARAAIEAHGGHVVKMTGDGVHAAFEDPLGAVLASVQLQLAMLEAEQAFGLALRVRCGLHVGESERRDADYFGADVNRAARIMGAAHGGQTLLSRAVAERIAHRLPENMALRELGAIRLRDLTEPEQLYQVVHARLPRDFPALRSAESPTNLPRALTTFVGRERELAEARELLRRSRLVTLVGTGGVGKTRLALRLAAQCLEEFPDGVWLVELDALADASRVPEAIATALGVREEAGGSYEQALVRHARRRAALIVLDNCEHLREACAVAAHRLLTGTERLRILCTSREALAVSGEAIQALGGLAVPGPRQAVDPAAAMAFESVQLFVDRARAASSAFAADEAQTSAIAAICHRLDGIPLAIELAAARTRTLSVQQIAVRLDDRFRLLSSRDPVLPPKQRTLRALIDWSYELLTEPEAALLRQLAVFAGGWTLEAAEAVCTPGLPEGEQVLENLERLVDKSLVAMEPGGERYRLLETVRQYAHARLNESRDAAAARDRHLGFFLALAERAKAGLTGPEQSRWLEILDRERENVLAAHAHAGSGGRDPEPGLRLANAVKLYWGNRGLLELGLRVTREALARLPTGDRGFLRCRGLYEAGQLASYMGRYDEARSDLEESLAIARELGNENAVGVVLQPLGMAALGQGDAAAARVYLEEAFERASRGDNRRGLAAAAIELGQFHRAHGDRARARRLYEQAEAIVRELGDHETVAIARLDLAMLCILEGKLGESAAHLLQALDIAAQLRSRRMTQSVFEVGAGLAARRGEWETAARLNGAAARQASRTGVHREPADEAFLSPLMAEARRALGTRYEELEAEGRALSRGEAMRATRAWVTSR